MKFKNIVKIYITPFMQVLFGLITIFFVLVIISQIRESNLFECYGSGYLCSKELQSFFNEFFRIKYIPYTLIFYGMIFFFYTLIDPVFRASLKIVEQWKFTGIAVIAGFFGYYIFRYIFNRPYLVFILMFTFIFIFWILLPLLKRFSYSMTTYLKGLKSGSVEDISTDNFWSSVLKVFIKNYRWLWIFLVLALLVSISVFSKHRINVFSKNYLEYSHYIVGMVIFILGVFMITLMISDTIFVKSNILDYLLKSTNDFLKSDKSGYDIKIVGPFEGYIKIKTFVVYSYSVIFDLKLNNPKGIELSVKRKVVTKNGKKQYIQDIKSTSNDVKIEVFSPKALKRLILKGNNLYIEMDYSNVIKNNFWDDKLIGDTIRRYYEMVLKFASYIDGKNLPEGNHS